MVRKTKNYVKKNVNEKNKYFLIVHGPKTILFGAFLFSCEQKIREEDQPKKSFCEVIFFKRYKKMK